MTDFNQFHESFSNAPPPPKKMPDMLNVLTILTFIGCAYDIFNDVLSYFIICTKSLAGENEKLANTPFAGLLSSLSETMVRSCQMRIPVLIIQLAGITLCFIGALQMRKLKKSGFFLYLIGELGVPLVMVFLIGGIMAYAGLFFPVIFIILYATQVKHLK